MIRYKFSLVLVLLVLTLSIFSSGGCNKNSSTGEPIPQEIKAIFDKPLYDNAIWGLRVVDLDTGRVIYNLRSDFHFFIGSVRKLFSTGLSMGELGADHMFRTPVHRQGSVDESGILEGDLILVATGDLTMGGRRNPDGTMAISGFDHNEADSLGNAVLTEPDPLWGYRELAQQIADSGITEVTGEIIIDDRLFEPFKFRDEPFNVRPIYVNDDLVDVTMNPAGPGELASVVHRPESAAFDVESTLVTGAAGSEPTFELSPEFPECFGQEGCMGEVSGVLPIDFVPDLTNEFPLVQTFRIVRPDNYARTVFIEALEEAGVTVHAAPVAQNPVNLLPAQNSYTPGTRVAELVSLPYSEYIKLILKVSYNIGADTSLVLYGLTQGVNNMDASLAVERQTLETQFGIPGNEFHFVDGSGGGLTTGTNKAVIKILDEMSISPVFPEYLDALPILGVDGSLGFVTDFEKDPELAGAKGNAFAKTGTFARPENGEIIVKGQALAGYIDTKGGKRLLFIMNVLDVPAPNGIPDLLQIFQDQGTITAIIWKEN